MAKTTRFPTLPFLLIAIAVIFQLSAVTSTIDINNDVKVQKGGGSLQSNNGKWCVPKPGTTYDNLQVNVDWVCSHGIDCKPISPGGVCFDNNNIETRATYTMNAYYQSKRCTDAACDFGGTGMVTTTNPSTSTCDIPIWGRCAEGRSNMEGL